MPFWLTLALSVFSFIATALLAPKPNVENAKPGKLGDFRFPRSDEGTPIPLFWGRVRMRGPNTLWYGALRTIAITEKVKTGLFSSKRVTVAHRYLVTFDMAIGLLSGSRARLRRIWFGEKLAWAGDTGNTADDAVAITINEPSIFGGHKSGGGLVGTARFYPGTFTQSVNAFVRDRVPDGTILPAYRGLSHIVFEDFEVGEQPSIRAVNFEIESIPSFLGLGGVGSNGDANPAEVLYDILINGWARLGFSSTAINAASFTAAGTTLNNEGHGISMRLESANDARDAIQEILQQIDGLIYEDPLTREIHLRLVRNDYDADDLTLFDETNVREVGEYAVSTWAETYNQARVTYTARDSDYKDKPAFAQDLSNISFQGGTVRSVDFRYPGITSAATANSVVARELALASIPLIKLRLTTNREGSTLRPGDVFRLDWGEYGVENLVLRVQKFDLGTLDDNRVVINCVQDRFAVADTVFSDPPESAWSVPDTAARAVEIRQTIELPRFLNTRLIENDSDVLGTDPDESYLQHLALAPNSLHSDFEAQVSEDAGASYQVDNDFTSFTATALLNTAVGINTAEVITGASTFVLKTVSDTNAVTGAAQSVANLRSGANLLLIGTEIIAYRSITDNGNGTYALNDVYRGLLDTSPRAHAENARVWFLGFVELENFGAGNYDGTEALRIRFVPQNGFSTLNPNVAPISDLTLQARPRRPLPPVDVQFDSVLHPASLDIVNSPFTVTWKRRNRLSEQVDLPVDADSGALTGVSYIARWTVASGTQQELNLGSGTTATLDLGTATGAVELSIVATDGTRESLYPVTRSFNLVNTGP